MSSYGEIHQLLQQIITDRTDIIGGSSSANMPYCQYFTFPEVDAVAYGCGTTSDTTWRTVLLTSTSSTVSLNTTSTTSTTSSTPSTSLQQTSSSFSISPFSVTPLSSVTYLPSVTSPSSVTPLSSVTLLPPPTQSAVPPISGPIQGEKDASDIKVVSSTNAIARFDYPPKDRSRDGLWSSIHTHHNWVSLSVFKVPRLVTDKRATRIYWRQQMGKRKLPPPSIEPEKSPASQEAKVEGQESVVEARD
jgi:hypothetical protein